MNVHIQTPYDLNKNLGLAYNKAMSLLPDGDSACFVDGDISFLTPDFGVIINEYANANTNAILTCWTNRIHELAKGQLHPTMRSTDMAECIRFADSIKHDRATTLITGSVSGLLMVIPKHIWQRFPFTETKVHKQPGESNCLGVDNDFTNRVRAAGIPVLRMNGLFVYHVYRLLQGVADKTHLL